jgi:hypothetical protein
VRYGTDPEEGSTHAVELETPHWLNTWLHDKPGLRALLPSEHPAGVGLLVGEVICESVPLELEVRLALDDGVWLELGVADAVWVAVLLMGATTTASHRGSDGEPVHVKPSITLDQRTSPAALRSSTVSPTSR